MRSRYGSHALACGARAGGGGHGGGGESVDTSLEMAGFAVPSPGRPRPRTGMPAAFRYSLAVSRRMPVSRSIRRSGHPRRPSATTCCCRCVSKTFPMSTLEHRLRAEVNVSVDGHQEMAGFEVSINGRFWVSTEGARKALRRIPHRTAQASAIELGE